MVCTSGIQHNRNLEPNENGISQGSMVGRCMVSRTTPKHTALVWIAVHNNRLSTGDRMLKWNPHAITKCWLCNDPMETRDHLFFTCSYSEEVWRKVIQNILGSGYSNEWNQLLLVLGSTSSCGTACKSFYISISFHTNDALIVTHVFCDE